MSTGKVLLVALGLGAVSGITQAQLRCDCTSIVDTCKADVAVRGSWIDVKSDRQQCSRVDYFVDGLPFVSVVVNGEDRQNWIPRSSDPKVIVQSCQVCRDTNSPSAATQPAAPKPAAANVAATGKPAESKLEPLISSVPEYPAAAAARRLEGYVDLEFTVTPAGTVENARVTGARPRGVFDAAALAAVTRRRYPADPSRAPVTLKERMTFRPPAGPSVGNDRSNATAPTGPRNQCIHQNAVYNYGETIDVGLMSSCRSPLLVFSCAVGTGKYMNSWVCTSSDEQGNLLVTDSDARIGQHAALPTATGVRTYGYADSFVVPRAPNSEYWWVACDERDTACASTARQWVRSVDGQPSSVDPSARSSIAVARSY